MNWLNRLLSRSPKARVEKAKGNHVENLAAHPAVDLAALERHGMLDIPVWIEVPPDDATPHTYDGWLWEVEPMGEYLYYLAGNFPKNEKGLLRYASATTRIEVHVSFEDDVLSVAEYDSPMDAERATASGRVHTDFAQMTVAEADAVIRAGGVTDEAAFAVLKGIDRLEFAYVQLFDPHSERPSLRARCDMIEQVDGDPRLLRIEAFSTDPTQKVGPLCEAVIDLYHRYSGMPPHRLSGAIRM